MTDISKREVKQLENSGLSRAGISVLASHRLLMSADRFTIILSCCQNERNCWKHQLSHGHSSLSHHCKTLQSSQAHVALAEDPVLVPATYMVAYNSL